MVAACWRPQPVCVCVCVCVCVSGNALLFVAVAHSLLLPVAIACVGVCTQELADGKNRLLKMGVFLLGYGLMSLLAVWA